MPEPLLHRAQIDACPQASRRKCYTELVQPEVVLVEFCTFRTFLQVVEPWVARSRAFKSAPSSLLSWVQLGCNKTSQQFLRVPKLAIDAVNFHTVISEPQAFTAGAAGSSLVLVVIRSAFAK